MGILPRTVAALLVAAVVCSATGVEAQTSSTPVPPQGELERAMLGIPFFATLHDADPEGFAMVVKLFETAAATNAAREVVGAQAQAIFMGRVGRYIAAGSDEGVVGYYTAFLRRVEVSARVDIGECHRLVTGDVNADPAPPTTPEMAQAAAASLQATLALLESTKGRSPVKLTEVELTVRTEKLRRLVESVATGDRDLAILRASPADPKDHARSCELNTTVLKRILALPTAEAADMLRILKAMAP